MARYEPLPYVRPERPRNLRLADLYLRQGEQQAEAERRRGDIQAQLWGGIANTVGQTAAQMIQAPQQERERQAKEAREAQQTKLGALQLGEAERAVNDRENFDLAMSTGSRQKTLAALKDRPELYEKAQAHFTKIDTSMKQLLGDTAAGIADFGYTPEAAMAAMDDLLEQGFDERKIAPFRAAIQQNPGAVKQLVDSLLAQSPDPRHQAMAKPQPLVELNKDTILYDPNKGEVVASGPQSPAPREPNPTEASLAMAAAAGDPAALKALNLLKEQRATPQSDNEPLVPVIGPDGKPVYARRSDAVGKNLPAGAEKPSSGVQKHTLAFFNRAEQADKDLEELEPWIAQQSMAGQARLEHAPNWAQTSEGQRYTQAQRAFTEARLRKDSGAAIPDTEFDNDRKTYFPVTGDDAKALEQKRRARAAILSSLAFESGQALGEFLGDADEAAATIQYYKKRASGVEKSGGGGTPKEGDTKPIEGYPGTEQTYRNGKWIRTK